MNRVIAENQASFEKLVHAIVMQAVRDWRCKRNVQRSAKARQMVAECEEFFESEWFTFLTGMDGKCLLKRLKKGG